MSEEKELTRGEQLRRALVYERKNGWDRLDAEEGAALEAYCTGYKQFLDAGKTERECVDRAIAQAEAAGFRAYVRGMELKPGDRIYQVNRDKAIMLAVMGRKGLEHGVNIGAAHIDSPRLDLKPNPLYEDGELAYFKTHYYGGIRKYQWVTIPLELHGVVALKNGEVVRVSVGNGPDDPMFTIDDLLPVSEYRKKIFTKSRVESSWYKYNGQETCLVTRYIDDLDWYLIVEKDTAIIKESLLSQLCKDILVVACIIILILLLVSGTVSRYDKFMTLFATTDKLTGLMNRERFNAILSRKLWERPLVFMFDVDHFKHINDTRGHLWGNEVLARVGHKAEEIVGKAGCVARWGGDEFIGFIDAPGDAEETLRCLLESVRDLDNHVTISIGATRINPEDDMDAILMRVDDGMYRSKAEGRDRITYV